MTTPGCVHCNERRTSLRDQARLAEVNASRGRSVAGHVAKVASLRAEIAACNHDRTKRKEAS